eukprot:CAMPEP_0116124884 /NCGR_PEP_ID=MMETSP0329-20121206/5520_1 /TAXON_ID=697910 /ORGANISM="Pseudo-nitzschia arenysensis, Strain B593" /LENGTH=335 /DNA_ID=CAMNT_0003618897 /DNA_START=49 /DNA_END=1056 /DNA_ORIENTATION=-
MKFSTVTLCASLVLAPSVASARRLGGTSDASSIAQANLPPMENVTSMASTSIRMATEKDVRRLKDYKGDLETMAHAAKTRLAREDRHLQSDFSASSQTCLSGTEWLLTSNPSLNDATINYLNSMEIAASGSSLTAYYSDASREDLRQECAQAGGMFDVSYGSLTCELSGTPGVAIQEYVGCLANTQECRAKENYEFLKWALESEGFSNCRAPQRPQQPVRSPTPYPSSISGSSSNNNYNDDYYNDNYYNDNDNNNDYNGNSNSTNRPSGGGSASIFAGRSIMFYVIVAGVSLLLLVGLIMLVCVMRRKKGRGGQEPPTPKIAQGTVVQGTVVETY